MKPIETAPGLYLVLRDEIPAERKQGRIITQQSANYQDHLYLGKLVVVPEWVPDGAGDMDKARYAVGDRILFVASAGWKLQHCPHAEPLELGKEELVILKEDDIVARVK